MNTARSNPELPTHDGESGASRLTRRTILGGAVSATALSALGVVAGSWPAAAASNPIPQLPGEVSRTATKVTRLGKKSFETIDVLWGTDRARLYVPWVTPPKASKAGAVIWFYHSNGSDRTALDGAYNYGAMMAVDQGSVCICPDFGGSLWTSQTSLTHQVNWSKYVSGVFNVGVSFARANSGGGALMCYAYGTGMVPALRGMYLANAVYDVEDVYTRDPTRVGPPYNNDPALVAATNPAKLPQNAWAGKRLKTVVSLVDPIVPPAQHGLALATLAQPVATDVRIQYHDQGHTVPSWTQSDMITTFSSWL